ncbi:MAG: sigma-70 family RNA polymerase sigma factor [Prochloraceae cyanobacterium]|nr:sigma-70 family RNA polymerase sigma factor [Prochloraceae cyanobacterium]
MIKVLKDDRAETPDTQLVLLTQQGDRSSFGELYRRYHKRVRSTLYQLCGEYLLDDLEQEVFLRVWKGLPKLREASYFATWIYRITWNVASDRRRHLAKSRRWRQKQEAEIFSVELAREEHFASDCASRPQDSPDLMQLHYQDLVQRGLQNLSLEHRAVLVLHDLEDVAQKEIAEILNIPLGTVKSRLFHARKAIRKFLQEQGASL